VIRVTLNKLDNPPHTHGEAVLIAGTDTWDLTVMCVSGGYWGGYCGRQDRSESQDEVRGDGRRGPRRSAGVGENRVLIGRRRMFPNEQENREELARHFASDFLLMGQLAKVAIHFHEDLCHVKGPDLTGNAKEFLLGTFTRELRRFRSCIELCAMGYTENATILTRSMYEGLLAERFVIGTPIPDEACSTSLINARSRLPKFPMGGEGEEVRSYLCRAMEPLRMSRLRETLHDQAELLAQTSKWDNAEQMIESMVGADWLKTLKKSKHYSGMNVRLCAESCGLLDYHVKLYGLQSAQVHADDAFRYVNSEAGNALLVGLVNSLPMTLFNSANMLGMIMHDLNERFAMAFQHDLEVIAIQIGERLRAL
jgi:hypothetical protein